MLVILNHIRQGEHVSAEARTHGLESIEVGSDSLQRQGIDKKKSRMYIPSSLAALCLSLCLFPCLFSVVTN